MKAASQTQENKSLLSPDEFREMHFPMIGRNNLYELLRAKRIKSIKVGRKILIPASEVQDFPLREVGT